MAEIINFNYTGAEQTWICPEDGFYKFVLNGAQGGTIDPQALGGKGGKTVVYRFCTAGETLYIYVGGKGSVAQNGVVSGGFNGGGSASSATLTQYGNHAKFGSGGGATHVATRSGQLSSLSSYVASVVGIAGGGGGDGENYYGFSHEGGTGGGSNGGNAEYGGLGGTQSSGNAFGSGQSVNSGDGSGGGSGLFGGFSSGSYGAGGGSGYVPTPYVVFKGTTYQNSTENGLNSGNGSASVELVAKAGINAKLGNNDVLAVYKGTVDIVDAFKGINPLT